MRAKVARLMPFVPLVFSPRALRRHPRLATASVLFVALAGVELGSGHTRALRDSWVDPVFAAVGTPPAPLSSGDGDGDGLPDEREAELARTFAPLVLLDKQDGALPASVSWVMEKSDFVEGAARVRRTRRAFDDEVRKGSERPEDWVTYVDVYPRASGGIHLEYWFYYPYNEGPAFFDHESDWEHMTVRLDEESRPVGAYLARHEDNDPGPFFSWSRLRKEGSHPVVLSARGTHATYADEGDLAWFEGAATSCADLATCEDKPWRTWEGGGLSRLDAVPSNALAGRAFRFDGRWGATGFLPGTSAPRGPMFQSGHCAGGFVTCRKNVEMASLP